ncbi:MAG: hypothetical protein HYZ16_04160 [Bacteroidetes bacterium]|jgi:hypothetical protein|nr:hypothetical protein [Bacteroidota bacterium]
MARFRFWWADMLLWGPRESLRTSQVYGCVADAVAHPYPLSCRLYLAKSIGGHIDSRPGQDKL